MDSHAEIVAISRYRICPLSKSSGDDDEIFSRLAYSDLPINKKRCFVLNIPDRTTESLYDGTSRNVNTRTGYDFPQHPYDYVPILVRIDGN